MRSLKSRIWTIGIAAVALFALAVDSTAERAPDPVEVNTTVDVSINNQDFIPPILSIQVGDTVRWTNDSAAVPHTTTSGTPWDSVPGLVWDSGLMSPGETFTFVFDSAAEYDYFCMPHSTSIFGQIIVGGSGVQVAMVPDDIRSFALPNLEVDLTVFNFTAFERSGDLWFTVVLPSGGEIVIPASFLSLPSNPIFGVLAAMDQRDFFVTISVPPAAPVGHYIVKAKIGPYPSIVVDETSFEFNVPAL
jgi:plastocyanin